MKMGSPATVLHKRVSKPSNTASHASMTTSTAKESFVESTLFSWVRVFRFATLLCRPE